MGASSPDSAVPSSDQLNAAAGGSSGGSSASGSDLAAPFKARTKAPGLRIRGQEPLADRAELIIWGLPGVLSSGNEAADMLKLAIPSLEGLWRPRTRRCLSHHYHISFRASCDASFGREAASKSCFEHVWQGRNQWHSSPGLHLRCAQIALCTPDTALTRGPGR